MTVDKFDRAIDRLSSYARLLTPIGVIVMIYLTSKFATKDELRDVSEKINRIDTSIALIVLQKETLDKHESKLDALYNKLQILEVQLAKFSQ